MPMQTANASADNERLPPGIYKVRIVTDAKPKEKHFAFEDFFGPGLNLYFKILESYPAESQTT